MTEKSVFDKQNMLRRLLDDEGLVQEVIYEFVSDIPVQIAILKDALSANDVELAHRQAHTIKGAAANASAEQLRAIAWEVEQSARAEELKRAAEQMPVLEQEYQALVTAFSESGFDVSKKAA